MMYDADPIKVSEIVADKHFDNVKAITKCFIDSTNENYKACSKYAAFIAWTT
jgi:hypothetical protein